MGPFIAHGVKYTLTEFEGEESSGTGTQACRLVRQMIMDLEEGPVNGVVEVNGFLVKIKHDRPSHS